MSDLVISIDQTPWRSQDVQVFPAAKVKQGQGDKNPSIPSDPVQVIAVTDEGSMDSIVEAQAAYLVTGTEGSDTAIRWTAQEAGAAGNDITVEILEPTGAEVSLSVDVTGTAIVVTPATDITEAVTSTANDVKTAVEAEQDAADLVAVADEGDSDGSGLIGGVTESPLKYGSADLEAGLYMAVGTVQVPVNTGFPDDDESATVARYAYRTFRVVL